MSNVPTRKLRKGHPLYRVLREEHDEQNIRLYDALDPNPFSNVVFDVDSNTKARYVSDNSLVPGRFAPFRDADSSKAVPALYLGESNVCAYYEAILRPLGGQSKGTISKAGLADMRLARVSFAEDLVLADCRRQFLEGESHAFWPYSYDQLFNESQFKVLNNARSLAKLVHDEYQCAGLIWDSVQTGGAPVPAIILFGDRRDGEIHEEIGVLEDLCAWKPYLIKAQDENQVIIHPDLIPML